MELIFRICLFIAGVINFVPSVLAFIPSKISSSYGVDLLNANYELLLRHRAVLFGIVGGFMIYSAFTKKYYSIAVVIGLIAMVSFIILYTLLSAEVNTELNKVMKFDVAGIVILSFGLILYKFNA